MKKKKQRKGAVELEWATAHFFSKFESQYNKLYCDTGPDRHGLGDRPGCARAHSGKPRHGMVGLGHGPATRPTRATTRPARAQGHVTARARGLIGGGVAIQTLYRGWGAALCRDTARNTAAIRLPAPCDKAQGRCDMRDMARSRDLCRDTILYRDQGRS